MRLDADEPLVIEMNAKHRAIESLKLGLIGPEPPPYGGMANQFNQLKQLLTDVTRS